MARDILTDNSTGDILIKDGDFVVGDSDMQNLEDLIISLQGDYKQSPTTGAGGRGLRNNRNKKIQEFERNIKEQLAADFWNEQEVTVKSVEDITVIADKK